LVGCFEPKEVFFFEPLIEVYWCGGFGVDVLTQGGVSLNSNVEKF
jgi:hypothetical protein